MKRVVIAIVLILFAFSITIAENLYIRNSYNDLVKKINLAEEYVNSENYKMAKLTSYEIEKKWEKQEEIFALFISQDHLQKISLSITNLKEFSNKEYKGFFLSQTEQVKFLLNHIKKDENFNLTGIF